MEGPLDPVVFDVEEAPRLALDSKTSTRVPCRRASTGLLEEASFETDMRAWTRWSKERQIDAVPVDEQSVSQLITSKVTSDSLIDDAIGQLEGQ